MHLHGYLVLLYFSLEWVDLLYWATLLAFRESVHELLIAEY